MAALSAAVALMLAGCAAEPGDTGSAGTKPASSAKPVASAADYLFVQEAGSGSFTTRTDGFYDLVLTGVDANTVYFADRPVRDAGSVPTAQFLSTFSWEPTAPNAAIVLRHGDSAADTVAITIDRPSYDAAAGTLTYRAKPLGSIAGTDLASFEDTVDGSIPESFDDVALFIDDGDSPICTTNAVAVDGQARHPDGTTSQVGDLDAGMLVRTAKGTAVAVMTVSAPTNEAALDIRLEEGNALALTPTTCLATPNGTVPAARLEAGDRVVTESGVGTVAAITAAPGTVSIASITTQLERSPTRGEVIFVNGIGVLIPAATPGG